MIFMAVDAKPMIRVTVNNYQILQHYKLQIVESLRLLFTGSGYNNCLLSLTGLSSNNRPIALFDPVTGH